MVRVTAFLRVSMMSAALTAPALTAALPVLSTAWTAAAATSGQATGQTGGNQTGAAVQKPAHGTPEQHGGRSSPSGAASSGAGGQAAGATTPQPTTPAAGCQKPGAPLCMDDQATFLNADKMSSCQGEVKEYVDKSMAYLTCLNEENMATGRELSRNVDRFNCRLSGRKGCPN
ncbi:hypothetical protein [Azospirillum sp. B510]|uniref:hypothetical protein n=1 Tax=Azospirillum sp. (strain B510) TaxID=137722 RepID=UPI0011D12920|nr:hypothetical protein [Azospirillum sp. B510]